MRWCILPLLIALTAAGLAPAATDVGDAPTGASRVDAGAALAQLIYPAAMDEALMTYTFTKEVAAAYHADPNLQALDAKHPGLVDAMIGALRVEYRKARIAAMPLLWTRTGMAYAASLDASELRQARAFHASPAGRRLVGLVIQGVAGLAPSGDSATPVMIYPAEPAPADETAWAAFDATAAGRKLAALRATIAAINADWTAKAVPDQALVSTKLSQVVASFGIIADELAHRTLEIRRSRH